MAYSELIKNFERVREYMRDFFVYGFKSRSEYDLKSARSYDNERRRIESWLGGYMGFRQDERGKNVFLSVDSRSAAENPLYKAFKAKSFTAGDITFHFWVLDLLADGRAMSLREISDAFLSEYAARFESDFSLDDSTLRKKLREYVSLGLIHAEKRGREYIFKLSEDGVDLSSWSEALAFFSEADPLGLVGSFLLDKLDKKPDQFRFKHHYILHAMDIEVLYALVEAMNESRAVELSVLSRRTSSERTHTVFPVKIYVSVQTGRQYLLAYHYRMKRPRFYRLDTIRRVVPGSVEHNPARYSGWYDKFDSCLWGVSAGDVPDLDHVEMTVHFEPSERYILDRLEREKRCGTVELLDESTARFSADVFDASEMLPWLRTFIGRIVSLECSNEFVTNAFYSELESMAALYGGECDAV